MNRASATVEVQLDMTSCNSATQFVNVSPTSRAAVLHTVTSAFVLCGACAALLLPEPKGRIIG